MASAPTRCTATTATRPRSFARTPRRPAPARRYPARRRNRAESRRCRPVIPPTPARPARPLPDHRRIVRHHHHRPPPRRPSPTPVPAPIRRRLHPVRRPEVRRGELAALPTNLAHRRRPRRHRISAGQPCAPPNLPAAAAAAATATATRSQ